MTGGFVPGHYTPSCNFVHSRVTLNPPLSLASTWRHPVSLVFGVCNPLIMLLMKNGLTGSNPVAPTILTTSFILTYVSIQLL